ncbi:putative polyglutamate biosynthesis protein [Zopfia rhizophila CBS 207.26]|uniref:Putative polyglutamate biosynthesis protein n=1 Tax=Zopfia rhizophila CBS 207.26 TaxID=1314779 RepID=A0A6A6DFI5_9PEZI|nr:putative polyglutamate biosynthesis protein [Zopfia rhizophila CBS 207.26]
MPPQTRFHLNFVGDVMLGRLIDQLLPTHIHCPEEARHIDNFVSCHPELREYGSKSPWGNTLPIFRSADLNLINLETSATTHPKPWPNKVFNYRMHPANIECLKEARISYVSLANNHTLDFSEAGLLETVRTIKGSGIAFAGAGETRDEAYRPAVLSIQGGSDEKFTAHVYSASDHPSDWSKVPNFHFIDYSSSTRSHLRSLLKSSTAQPNLKVFSVHWGPNHSWVPSDDIRSLAHFLVDECEVDIVHGHSSHHIQGAEVYKGRLIIYGCGDFVDDYAVDAEFRNDLSAVWRVAVEKARDNGKKLRVSRLEVFPSRIKHFQTHLLDKDDRDHKWVRSRFSELSKAFGTKIQDESGEDGQIVAEVP